MTNIPIKSAIYMYGRMMLSNNNDANTHKKYVAQDICTTYYKYKD